MNKFKEILNYLCAGEGLLIPGSECDKCTKKHIGSYSRTDSARTQICTSLSISDLFPAPDKTGGRKKWWKITLEAGKSCFWTEENRTGDSTALLGL